MARPAPSASPAIEIPPRPHARHVPRGRRPVVARERLPWRTTMTGRHASADPNWDADGRIGAWHPSPILLRMGGMEEPEPLPHGLEQIEAIVERLHRLLMDLQDVNRANYPPSSEHPGPLHSRFTAPIADTLNPHPPLSHSPQPLTHHL